MHGLAWCGARCYSLYLLHLPILGLILLAAGRVEKPKVNDLATLGLAVLAAALIIADICYRRVELPFMELAGQLAPNHGQAPGTIPVAAAELERPSQCRQSSGWAFRGVLFVSNSAC